MKVLIVGAGVAGLALAATLIRDGHTLRIVEKRPANDDRYGAGLLLTPNAVLALDAVLRDPSWRETIRRVNCVTFADSADRPLFDIRCDEGWPAPFATLRHYRLRDLLLTRIHGYVEHGTTVTDIRCRDGHVIFTDGSTERFDLVIGADGVHSLTRSRVFGHAGAATAPPFEGYRCVIPNTAQITEPRQLIGNGATLLLYPLPDAELYVGAGPVASAVVSSHADPATAIRETFHSFGCSASAALENLPGRASFIPTRYWTVRQQPWSRGCFALIGDAAHASPPTLAQGAAMALEDAAVLAAAIDSHRHVSDALRSYESQRRPRVERVQAESVQRLDANQPMSPRAVQVRDHIARRVGRHSLESTWKWLAHECP